MEEVEIFNYTQEIVNLYNYNRVILEIILPDDNGFNLITQLKQRNVDSCIIVVSNSNLAEDKIRSLNVGSDDYLDKPFYLAELDARIKAALGGRKISGCQEIFFLEIRMDVESRQVYVN